MGGFKNGTRYRGLLTTGVAHGVLAGISFAFLFPLGAILLRVIPGKGAVASHVFAQMLAYLLYISAAALGLYLVSNLRSPSGGSLLDNASTNAHPLIGIVLLVVVVFQPTLGVLHHRRFEKFKRRTWVSYVHIGVGRLAIPLGIINGGLGLQLAGTTGAAVIAYGIVSAIMFILWVIATLTRRTQDATGQEKEESPKVIQEQERDQVGRRASPRVEAPRPEGDGSARLPTAAAAAVPVAEQDMPSPPYTPGPHYAAHMAQVLRQQQPNQDGGGVQSMKEGMGTYEIMLADAEEMRRGQV
ncbi:hypothetical protein F4802DRAFT_574366 [Xylaria palmicola]|nr:hypothetical protein F4802DRAFT_574366 [Xylaria palmicola]